VAPDIQKDPLYNTLFTFPIDDIEVFSEKRNLRTVDSTLPVCNSPLTELTLIKKDANSDTVDPAYLKDCVEFYKMDWPRVKRKYEEPPTNDTLTRSQLLPRKLEIEMPLEDEAPNTPTADTVEADEIDRSLFGEYKGAETDKTNASQRVCDSNSWLT
jgi:hypothetical protein